MTLAKKIALCIPVCAFLALTVFLAAAPAEEKLRPGSVLSVDIRDRSGKPLRTVLSQQSCVSRYRSLSEISPWVAGASVVLEDKRFYRHHGVDPAAVARAFADNLKARRIVSGASTITQQLAESVFELPAYSLWGKIGEAFYALKLELHLSKDEILELYLNRIFYGNGCYGIEAASQGYFGRSACDLSAAQSAFLASIPQSPSFYDPYRNPGAVMEKQRVVLAKMLQRDLLSRRQYEEALAEEIVVRRPSDFFLAPHFCDYLLSEGHVPPRASAVNSTLDLELQRTVENLLARHVSALKDKFVSNGAVLVIENRTGHILAMAGSADYFSAGGQVNAALALRQPGSCLKPFTYALALESGKRASDLIADLPLTVATENGRFSPSNYDGGFHGPVRLREALACSYNIPAVRLSMEVGFDFLYRRLQEAGFEHFSEPPSYYGAGLTLGNGEVTLLELVRAYRLFAAGGRTVALRAVDTVEYGNGSALPGKAIGAEKQVFSPQTAYVTAHILSDNHARYRAFGRHSALNLPFLCLAKTGTTKEYRDNWTVGSTVDYTVGVWVGNFDGSPMRDVSGVTGAAPLFRDVMLFLHRNALPEPFSCPPSVETGKICTLSGMLPGENCADVAEEVFIGSAAADKVCSFHRKYSIDRRTGAVASPSSDPEYVTEKIFTVFPPQYIQWALEQGFELPPAAGDATDPEAAVSILFPGEGETFRIDPVLRRQYQKISLRAVSPAGGELLWKMDGVEIGRTGAPFILEWQLVKGEHVLEVESPLGKASCRFAVY